MITINRYYEQFMIIINYHYYSKNRFALWHEEQREQDDGKMKNGEAKYIAG